MRAMCLHNWMNASFEHRFKYTIDEIEYEAFHHSAFFFALYYSFRVAKKKQKTYVSKNRNERRNDMSSNRLNQVGKD